MERDICLFSSARFFSFLICIVMGNLYGELPAYQQDYLTIAVRAQQKPKPKPSKPRSKKKMTILVYMAADGNLEPFVDFNKKQMERFGSDDQLNILLFICTHRANEQKQACKAVVYKNKTVILERIPHLDSGSKHTLLAACKWATSAEYAAEEFCVFLWDHGFGPLNRLPRRGICYDSTTGNFLSDVDLRMVFDVVTRDYLAGKKIGLIGFDACLMASLEIAHAIQPYAHYMVGSEQTVPALGLPYHMVLERFVKGERTPERLGHSVVDGYYAYYQPFTEDMTYSFMDLTKLQSLNDKMKHLTTIVSELLKKQKNRSVTKAMRAAVAATPQFQVDSFVDLGDWCSQMLHRIDSFACIDMHDTQRLVPQLRQTLSEIQQNIKHCVLKAKNGKIFARTCGLFVYLPVKYVDRSYLTSHWARTTEWPKLLTTFCAS